MYGDTKYEYSVVSIKIKRSRENLKPCNQFSGKELERVNDGCKSKDGRQK